MTTHGVSGAGIPETETYLIRTNIQINIVGRYLRTMPKTTTTTVTRNSEGQYQVTIPKALADAMDLADEKVEWDVVSSEKLQMAVKDD